MHQAYPCAPHTPNFRLFSFARGRLRTLAHDGSATATPGFNPKPRADRRRPLAHAIDAESGVFGPGWTQSPPIIGNFNPHQCRIDLDHDSNIAGVRVPERIVYCLLRDSMQLVTRCGWKRQWRVLDRLE